MKDETIFLSIIYLFIAEMLYMKKPGQKVQVPIYAKICSVLPLFGKYLAIYHSFEILVTGNRVCRET